jgi:hypothetical protein
MIKKLAIGAGALALTAGVAVAAPASAAPMNEGAACVQAGIGFLKGTPGSALGLSTDTLFEAAAKKMIDYSVVQDAGLIDLPVDLPEGSFLSLGQVVSLHASNPEFFPVWCAS